MRVGRDSADKALDPRFQLLKNEKGKPERCGSSAAPASPSAKRWARSTAWRTCTWTTSPGGAVNPLTLPFIGLRDTVPPRIQSISLVRRQRPAPAGEKGRPPAGPRSLGQVQIVVDAYDQMDGDLARRRLGLYKLGYQLLNADGEHIPGMERRSSRRCTIACRASAKR
jgi:hypothetical protein